MKKYDLNSSDDSDLKKTIEDNVLGRNEKLINLIKLINNIHENFVISIDGDWGCGKTFFVKQLMYLYRNYKNVGELQTQEKEIIEEFCKDYFVVYYNAWENDDHIKPLDSIMYNILNEFPKYNESIVNNGDIFALTKELLINFIEKSSFGIIKSDNLKDIQSFDKLADSIKTIEERKEALNKLLRLISKDKRVLLIVDELDRCNPNYAVKTLETIKHFYNNDGIGTIVVTNNNQLAHTIRHFYGSGFDGYGYLNRIYDTVIKLETESLDNYVQYYCDIMKTTHLPEDISFLLFKFLKFTYRDVNRYMSMYRIVEPYTSYGDANGINKALPESCIFLPFALALKVKNISDYNKFINCDSHDLLKKFFNKGWLDSQGEGYYKWFQEIFYVKEGEDLLDNVIRKYSSLFCSNIDRYYKFPYMEAISMLGNFIQYSDD